MRFHLAGSPALSLVAVLACRNGATPSADQGLSQPPASLALTRFRSDSVAFAQYSGVRSPATLVVRDAAAWAQLWEEIHATVEPKPDLPAIDFGQEMIVAAAMGSRNSGGYNILLTKASEGTEGVEIEVLETSPGAGCAVTLALTQPIDLARVERRYGPVRFVVRQQVRDCGP
jgi:hypothetical protein